MYNRCCGDERKEKRNLIKGYNTVHQSWKTIPLFIIYFIIITFLLVCLFTFIQIRKQAFSLPRQQNKPDAADVFHLKPYLFALPSWI